MDSCRTLLVTGTNRPMRRAGMVFSFRRSTGAALRMSRLIRTVSVLTIAREASSAQLRPSVTMWGGTALFRITTPLITAVDFQSLTSGFHYWVRPHSSNYVTLRGKHVSQPQPQVTERIGGHAISPARCGTLRNTAAGCVASVVGRSIRGLRLISTRTGLFLAWAGSTVRFSVTRGHVGACGFCNAPAMCGAIGARNDG